jgi:hypothetical protein
MPLIITFRSKKKYYNIRYYYLGGPKYLKFEPKFVFVFYMEYDAITLKWVFKNKNLTFVGIGALLIKHIEVISSRKKNSLKS